MCSGCGIPCWVVPDAKQCCLPASTHWSVWPNPDRGQTKMVCTHIGTHPLHCVGPVQLSQWGTTVTASAGAAHGWVTSFSPCVSEELGNKLPGSTVDSLLNASFLFPRLNKVLWGGKENVGALSSSYFLGVGRDWVHLEHRPLFGLLYYCTDGWWLVWSS
jgi:hypothetical protein